MNDFYANQCNIQAARRNDHETQITCVIWREQMMKGVAYRTNLFNEFII